MRTPSKSTLPIEPLGTALGTARGVALTAREKGLELLDSDAAHELLRKGQHVAIVARDRSAELLESDAAQEIVRRGKGVVSAAKGELIEKPTKSRKPLKMLLFIAGSAAGVAAAVVSKRMSTPMPDSGIPEYDDPSAQFPKKDGVIDLTSVAIEEGVTTDPAQDMSAMGDAEIGTAATAESSTGASGAASKPAAGAAAAKTTSAKATPSKSSGAPKTTTPRTAATGASNGSTTRPTTP